MTRISTLPKEQQTGKAAELLGMVQKKMGRVPNMMATLAQSPAALESYLNFSGALGGGKFNSKQRELLAVFVGQRNNCGYCVKAHTAIGKHAGLSDAQIESAKNGQASDAKDQALLAFADALLSKNGFISDQDLKAFKAAGFSDGEALETVAVVSLNIYTNYINHVADPVIDF